MKIKSFIDQMKALSIDDFIGVPDSTLKILCDYLNTHVCASHHFVPVNEGAAVALAAGLYLGEGKISCVYMQNSGIGNAINPIASLINEKVYDISMLFVIGYRGEPGSKDEPQHKFQGEITLKLLEDMNIAYALISKETVNHELDVIFQNAHEQLSNNKQFAIVVKKDTFEKEAFNAFENHHTLVREMAIRDILSQSDEHDMIVSTTGKISREVYEQCDALFANHQRAFLTVGSMGHASMIALGIALRNPTCRVICIDGDGASLMHMGSMAFLAKQACTNLLHITLNNEAHESVGGMPTNCQGLSFAEIAKSCGYTHTYTCTTSDELLQAIQVCKQQDGPTYIEVLVSLESRDTLGRPKESAIENKLMFMKHVEEAKANS